MCHAYVFMYGLGFEFGVGPMLMIVLFIFCRKLNHSLVLFCFCFLSFRKGEGNFLDLTELMQCDPFIEHKTKGKQSVSNTKGIQSVSNIVLKFGPGKNRVFTNFKEGQSSCVKKIFNVTEK